MAASFDPDSPPTTARSSTPSTRTIPTNEAIENVIERATASARAANGGRSPVIGRDTRTQLFVGNLPYRVRWQDLKDLFRKAGGTVLRADVCLGPDNRSRGYGTVLLASAEDAGRAIDMFNGYVWQTRTLEVRQDRLPNDFDSSAMATTGGPMSKLAHSLSPQPVHYANPSAIHPLGINSLSSPAPATTLSSSTPALGHSTLGMTTGMPSVFAQDSSILSNSDSVRASLVAEMSRSPSAIKLPPTSSTPSNAYDTLGMTSTGLVSSSLSSHTPVPSGNLGFGSNDPARRSLLIKNWPPQYGKSDFDQIFRTAGTILQSELPASNGSDNLGYGTVVYATEEEAKNAVVQFHGLELNGRRLSIRIGKPDQLSKSQLAASQERRRSDEMHPPLVSNSSALSGAPTATEATYTTYPSYISMPPPMPPAGYVMASPPQSPYDPYPPAVAYAIPSPTSTYPPPLNGGMYAYGTWAHQPHKPPSPPTAPLGGGGNSSASGSTAPATNGASSRIPPGTISLPSPSLTGYPPPAQMSPMHLPPITPSVPSFTFFSQPMPTPPVHPPYHMSPGLAPYSPLGSPGLYRHVNPYFNLSPGAPVPYHHDANAIANNGVIGSGVGGVMPNGQIPTPYFDMTAATAGSDAPQEYFPPMPVTSLTGAMHAMQISSSANKTGTGSGETTRAEEESSSFLEPVGVGRDGFPSLSAKPDEQKASDGVSRTGLTEWVTTPDDLPGSGSKDSAGTPNEQPSHSFNARNSPSVPAERSVSADPSKNTTPSSVGTTGSTSPGSSGPGRHSSGKKPKLTLGSIPGFSPPVMMRSGYAAIMSNGVNGTNVVANRAAAQGGAEQYRVNGSPIVLNAAAAHAARTNSSGGLGDDAHGHRRNSWTAEDASRRQAISPELHVGNGEGYVR